jgi:uncharacterized protein YndB with AHSA1/START domain
MTIIEESVDIMQPANKVFAYITDIENLPKWESNAMEAEQTSQGSTGVGATRRGVDRVLGQKIPWTSKITEYESDKRCCEVVTSKSSRMDVRLTFESINIGTRFTQVYDMEVNGFLKLKSPPVNYSKNRLVRYFRNSPLVSSE